MARLVLSALRSRSTVSQSRAHLSGLGKQVEVRSVELHVQSGVGRQNGGDSIAHTGTDLAHGHGSGDVPGLELVAAVNDGTGAGVGQNGLAGALQIQFLIGKRNHSVFPPFC